MSRWTMSLPLIMTLIGCSSGGGAEQAAGSDRKSKSSDARNSEDDDTDRNDRTDDGDRDGDTDDDGRRPSGGSGSCRDFQDQYSTKTNVSGRVKAPLIGSIDISVDATADVAVESSESGGSLTIDGQVTSARPALARSTAERGLGAYGDPMEMDYLSSEEQKRLDGWDGLDCLVMATKTLQSSSFNYTFDPALPLLVTPEAQGDFSKTIRVKSTVQRHFEESNGAAPGTYEGTAKLSKNGNAFKIEYDFGSGAPNIFATPFAAIEYVPDGDGGYERITAWIYLTTTDVAPVELKR